MKPRLAAFVIVATLAWGVLLFVSVRAVAAMGLGAAGEVFLADFGHPWRAQFGTDFAIHLLGIAAWMIWRSRSLLVGIACALLAINCGALFTVPYVLVAIWKAGGNVAAALSGDRYTASPSASA